MKHELLIGTRSGKLQVVSIGYRQDSRQYRVIYHCICDCGKTYSVLGDNFRASKVSSCGCIKRGRKQGTGIYAQYKDRKLAIIHFLYHLKRSQNRRLQKNGGEFLSFEEFVDLINKSCFYCGIEGSAIAKDNYNGQLQQVMSDTEVRYNGIDRIDSNICYTKENCVPCCKRCNLAKNIMSQKEFFDWVALVYQHITKKSDNFSFPS